MPHEPGNPPESEEQDPNVKELKEKVGKLVKDNFNGDLKKAFEHYDADGDNAVNADEISALLKDAGVGNAITRGFWVNGILAKLDKNEDKKVEWPEFKGGVA